ncbi:zinc-ribbon domain-containing protein [Ruminococcus sp. Marseille-P6503]|uniref:zinc-ribbon domain-containing protein n=1 Tax=Ruminococcus sp. Marseille-P6503 TaxID=2364796 RepID=UPI000F538C36|nr:zinc-ribbon domain-containing protein [Ruminococcus sp. Marseille-P6503]
MAFLNKLGEKISSGASAVSDSAKKMAETNKLNARINSDLAEVNKKYIEIGRAVKLRLMEGITDSEVIRLAGEIDALLAEVAQLNEQVNVLKGVKKCGNCGAMINADVMFCPSCGSKQEVKAQPEQAAPSEAAEVTVQETPKAIQPETVQSEAAPEAIQPENIQSEAEPEAAPASAEAVSEPEQPAVQPVIEEQPAPAFVFCTECGHKEAAGTKFCSECGNKLD